MDEDTNEETESFIDYRHYKLYYNADDDDFCI